MGVHGVYNILFVHFYTRLTRLKHSSVSMKSILICTNHLLVYLFCFVTLFASARVANATCTLEELSSSNIKPYEGETITLFCRIYSYGCTGKVTIEGPGLQYKEKIEANAKSLVEATVDLSTVESATSSKYATYVCTFEAAGQILPAKSVSLKIQDCTISSLTTTRLSNNYLHYTCTLPTTATQCPGKAAISVIVKGQVAATWSPPLQSMGFSGYVGDSGQYEVTCTLIAQSGKYEVKKTILAPVTIYTLTLTMYNMYLTCTSEGGFGTMTLESASGVVEQSGMYIPDTDNDGSQYICRFRPEGESWEISQQFVLDRSCQTPPTLTLTPAGGTYYRGQIVTGLCESACTTLYPILGYTDPAGTTHTVSPHLLTLEGPGDYSYQLDTGLLEAGAVTLFCRYQDVVTGTNATTNSYSSYSYTAEMDVPISITVHACDSNQEYQACGGSCPSQTCNMTTFCEVTADQCEGGCGCPDSLPYWDTTTCVASCPSPLPSQWWVWVAVVGGLVVVIAGLVGVIRCVSSGKKKKKEEVVGVTQIQMKKIDDGDEQGCQARPTDYDNFYQDNIYQDSIEEEEDYYMEPDDIKPRKMMSIPPPLPTAPPPPSDDRYTYHDPIHNPAITKGPTQIVSQPPELYDTTQPAYNNLPTTISTLHNNVHSEDILPIRFTNSSDNNLYENKQ